MNATKGYYSLVQYCPDLSRLEAANVGVVLFAPERRFVAARMSRGNDRIRRFFHSATLDFAHVAALKASIQERLKEEAANFSALSDLEHFIATRANEIRLTAPRPVKVFVPEEDLDKLYLRLVGGRSQSRRHVRQMSRDLEKIFQRDQIMNRIVRDVRVRVPAFRRELSVPFGFQNGRFNLIQPHRFTDLRTDTVVTQACRFAVEGESLYESPPRERGKLQLVIVGEFDATQAEERAITTEILCKNKVKLHTIDDLAKLTNEIRRTGKVVNQS